MTDIILRKDAKRLGLKRYFTGKPCKRGHLVERRTDSYYCISCQHENYVRRYTENKEGVLAQNKAWSDKNKDKHAALCKEWYQRNGELVNSRAAEWARNNPEKCKAAQKKWYANNKDVRRLYNRQPHRLQWHRQYNKEHAAQGRARVAARRAKQLHATPSYADIEAINFFYECCPKGFQVDHIIPLNGKHISGFHVAENLQWLTPQQNMEKSNRWPYG